MPNERCSACGFDGETWSDEAAIETIAALPERWAQAVAELTDEQLGRRPIEGMWSIAEYVDHVREVLFGMKFVLDSALGEPDIDLGEAPEPRFDPVPRRVEVGGALAALRDEAEALRRRLGELPKPQWSSAALISGERVDCHWVARHAVHDATHHLGDVKRLRNLVEQT